MKSIGQDYEVNIIMGTDGLKDDDNVDVEVIFGTGEMYVATFFMLNNIKDIMDRCRETGECNSGQYFWASDMIIVHKLTEEVIKNAVEDLLATGEFNKAFSGPIVS